jgi:hypothetical protein
MAVQLASDSFFFPQGPETNDVASHQQPSIVPHQYVLVSLSRNARIYDHFILEVVDIGIGRRTVHSFRSRPTSKVF